MKLYYANSVCSLAVRIIIHELNLVCEYEAVDLKTKRTETGADYLSINPKGPVPALKINEHEMLTENVVILQYLADKNHAVHLLPATNHMRRYRVLEWLNFAGTDLHRYCGPLFWNRLPEEVKTNVYWPVLTKKLDYVNQHLQSKKFLMGEDFTLADSYMFVILVWLAKLKIDMSPWPHLKRYFYDMKARSAVQAALNEERLVELNLA